MTIKGVNYMTDFEAKKAILEISKKLSQKDYAVACDGSISVRTGPNAIWITPSCENKNFLTQDKLMKINLEGKYITGAHKLYKENFLPEELDYHLEIYKDNQNITSLIHCYPPEVVVYSTLGISLKEMDFTKSVKTLGEIPMIDCKITKDIVENFKGALIKGNGCLTWGNNIFGTYSNLEILEYTTRLLNKLPKNTSYIEHSSKKIEDISTKNLKGVTELIKPSENLNLEKKVNEDIEKEKFIQEVVLQVIKILKDK